MAITNNQIMAMYRAENNIPQSVHLYTAGVWFNKGYRIKKGKNIAWYGRKDGLKGDCFQQKTKLRSGLEKIQKTIDKLLVLLNPGPKYDKLH